MPRERKRYKPKANPNKLGANDLTRSEKLFIERHRFRWNQQDYATLYGVPLGVYQAWERGAVPQRQVPYTTLGHLTEAENCVILRRRAGLQVQELAAEVGVTPWYVRLMERGDAKIDRLAGFWGLR